MLFNSFQFLVFFVVVTLLYFLLPHRFRWVLLLTASCYFYMAFVPIYILILGFTIIIDYFAGILIERAHGTNRKFYLTLSILANVGILVVFKYYNFLVDNISSLLDSLGVNSHIPYLSILLPIGLSFHTFQAMSYTIEVYRGNQKAERNFGIYSLYVMFYPQLVAGPIERPQNLLHQFRAKFDFDADRVAGGLRLMGWGLFKKVVIADRLGIITDRVFDNYQSYDGLSLLMAVVFFSFQIFCDFSGYSDIAIGAARVMGFKLMRNFDRPYGATSIAEFWQRWHISLSTWFRDYLYISLGGNRVTVPRWYLNIFIVFLVSGLWHGANWTFVVWGVLHGFYLVFARATEKPRMTISRALHLRDIPVIRKITTFALVAFAWIFFRATSIDGAIYIASHLTRNWPGIDEILISKTWFSRLKISPIDLALCFALIFFLEMIHTIQGRIDISTLLKKQPLIVKWSIYYALILSIILLGVFENKQFIYFQF